MSGLHGKAKSAQDMSVRMVGACLMAVSVYHLVTHVSTLVSHDVLTGLLLLFGGYLAFPDQTVVVVGWLASLLPWGKR